MTRFAIVALILAGLSACTSSSGSDASAANPVQDASQTVAAIVANTDVQGMKMPENIQVVMADCIVTHANSDEIATLAAAKMNPTADTNALVSQILAREATTACAASKLTQS